MKKNKVIYDFNEKIKDQIIQYCRAILESINKKYLLENEIFPNEFLEYLFMGCKKAYEFTGKFQLEEDDIVFLILTKKQADKIVQELKDNNVKFIGINRDDDLIFEFKDQETLKKFNTLK